jgi:hypothetical protein
MLDYTRHILRELAHGRTTKRLAWAATNIVADDRRKFIT